MPRENPRSAGSAALNLVVLVGLTLLLALAGYVGWHYVQTPMITQISPNPARSTDAVTLRGERFSTEIGANIVLFGDKTGTVLRAAPGQLEVRVPDLGLGAGGEVRVPVRVLSRGHVSAPLDLAVRAGVAIHSEVEEIASAKPPPSAASLADPSGLDTSPGEGGQLSPGSGVPAAGNEPRTAAIPAPARRPRSPASPAPTPGPDAPALIREAEGAASANRFEAAASLYDKVLEADPQNAKAKEGRAAVQAAVASLRRTFAVGKTLAEGKPVSTEKIKDFDTRGLSMKKPAEVPARLEFEVSPSRVKAGDAYSVKVLLRNEGSKEIKISGLNVSTTVNGKRAGGPAPPRVEEVDSGVKAALYEVSGVWEEGVTSWTLEVQVASGRGDTYRGLVTWK